MREKAYIVIACVGLLLTGVLNIWQYQQIASLNSRLAALTNQNSSLSKDKTNLSDQNSNLSKVVEAQKAQLDVQTAHPISTIPSQSSTLDTPGNSSASKAAGKFVITSVKNTNASDFSTPGEVALSGTVHVIYLTITNLTNANQMYTALDFKAITTSGGVITPQVYPGPAGQGVWNNSTLAPGGSKDVFLLFGQDVDITTLEWTAPGGSDTYLAPIPSFN